MSTLDPTPHLRRLGLDLRPGEGRIYTLLFGFHFLLLAFQYTVKSVRQSAFIDALGSEQLPLAYLMVAICTYPLMVLYQRMVCRFSVGRLLAASALIVAASLIGFGVWLSRAAGSPWPSVVFYLWTSVVGLLMVSQFWSFAGLRLDPRQARRLFAGIGAGGILGSIVGGQLARYGSLFAIDGVVTGPWGALAAGALPLVLLAGIMVWLANALGAGSDGDDKTRIESTTVPPPAASGFAVARRSPYLRWLSVGMLLAALVAQIVDLQFAWVVERNTNALEQRTAAFGNLYSVMGLAAFAFQILCTARIHRHLGMGFALRVLPTANGIGTLLFLAAAIFAPGFLLAAVWGLKIAENGLRYSLEQATRELLFLPIPTSDRAQAKAFVDVFVQRSAKGVAAVVLLSVTLGLLSVPHTAWLALATVVVWLWVVEHTRRRYVASFRRGLLERVPDRSWASTLDLRDAPTLEILIAGLGSPDPREVCHSLELLHSHHRGHLVPPWILAHDHPEVRQRALDIFRSCRRHDAAPWVERLLSDPAPPIRASAIRTLAAITPQDLCRPMRERLMDSDPRVRSVAVAYLAGGADPELSAQADDSLAEMISDPSPEVRREAAHALGEIEEPKHLAAVVQLLYDPHLEVVRAAIRTVEQRCRRTGASPLYAPTVVSHLRQRKLKHEARSALVAYGESIIPALQHFMFDPGEEIWVRRALPKTLASIGGPKALDALIDALATRDDLQRRKVIEALGTLSSADLTPDPAVIEGQIAVECHQFLRSRLDLWSLADQRRSSTPQLLERLLQDRMRRKVGNVFALLALLHPRGEIRAAHRGISRNRADHRAHALEFLDNLLTGTLRQQVFAVIDELPRTESLRVAHRLYGLSMPAPADVLDRYLRRPEGDADAAWLTAAALWFIHEEKLKTLYPRIRQVANRDENEVVQETAALVMRQVATG